MPITGTPGQLLEESWHQLAVMHGNGASAVNDEVRVVETGSAGQATLRNADAYHSVGLTSGSPQRSNLFAIDGNRICHHTGEQMVIICGWAHRTPEGKSRNV